MIDSSRSPRPLWSRVLTAILLVVAIVVAAWVVWVKELHHPNPQIHTLARPTASAGGTYALKGASPLR